MKRTGNISNSFKNTPLTFSVELTLDWCRHIVAVTVRIFNSNTSIILIASGFIDEGVIETIKERHGHMIKDIQ